MNCLSNIIGRQIINVKIAQSFGTVYNVKMDKRLTKIRSIEILIEDEAGDMNYILPVRYFTCTPFDVMLIRIKKEEMRDRENIEKDTVFCPIGKKCFDTGGQYLGRIKDLHFDSRLVVTSIVIDELIFVSGDVVYASDELVIIRGLKTANKKNRADRVMEYDCGEIDLDNDPARIAKMNEVWLEKIDSDSGDCVGINDDLSQVKKMTDISEGENSIFERKKEIADISESYDDIGGEIKNAEENELNVNEARSKFESINENIFQRISGGFFHAENRVKNEITANRVKQGDGEMECEKTIIQAKIAANVSYNNNIAADVSYNNNIAANVTYDNNIAANVTYDNNYDSDVEQDEDNFARNEPETEDIAVANEANIVKVVGNKESLVGRVVGGNIFAYNNVLILEEGAIVTKSMIDLCSRNGKLIDLIKNCQ